MLRQLKKTNNMTKTNNTSISYLISTYTCAENVFTVMSEVQTDSVNPILTSLNSWRPNVKYCVVWRPSWRFPRDFRATHAGSYYKLIFQSNITNVNNSRVLLVNLRRKQTAEWVSVWLSNTACCSWHCPLVVRSPTTTTNGTWFKWPYLGPYPHITHWEYKSFLNAQ